MIATLGGQPQVVTFALDALLAQGEEISEIYSEVYIVHPTFDPLRTRQAFHRPLQKFFDGGHTDRRGRPRCAPMVLGDAVLDDIRDERGAEATWQTVRNQRAGKIRESVERNHR